MNYKNHVIVKNPVCFEEMGDPKFKVYECVRGNPYLVHHNEVRWASSVKEAKQLIDERVELLDQLGQS